MAIELDIRSESPGGKGVTIVNGVRSENCYINGRWLSVSDEIVFDVLKKSTARELLERFDNIRVAIEDIDGVSMDVRLSKKTPYPKQLQQPSISANIDYMMEFWTKPWSISEQLYAMRDHVESTEGCDLHCGISEYDEDGFPIYELYNGFGIVQSSINLDEPLANLYSKCVEMLRRVHRNTEEELYSEVDLGKMVTHFNFPEPVKVACEQYLIYFSQFLMDLGVTAETELVNSGELTLLKVKPKDNVHALEEIRYLLSSYLSIATDSNIELSIHGNKDTSVLQLESNIFHLRGQLSLAAATIEAKQSTIENLRLSNYAKQSIAQLEKGKSHTVRESDNESLFGGIVVLSEWELSKGVKVNFAEIARKLKRVVK